MAEVAPPPYAAVVAPQYGQRTTLSSEDFPDDVKERHVLPEEDEEDSASQTVPSGGILLDRIKAKKQGSTIVDTSTGRILYHVEAVNRYLTHKGTLASFHKGEDVAVQPYASIDNIAVTLAPLYGGQPSQAVISDWYFLYHHYPILGLPPKHFKIDGVEYTLKMRWWSTMLKFDLVPSDPPKSAPLATFQSGRWRDRGDILIHPCAVTHSSPTAKGKNPETKPPQQSLLHDGVPTRLLDLALVAEAIYKTNLCQSTGAGVAAASAAAAAAGAAAHTSSSTPCCARRCR